jgi:hypothetical protein
MSILSMNYKKIYVYEKNCMLFLKEHKNDIEYMHCGRARYVKVINKMVHLSPQFWWSNNFVTFLSRHG